MRIIGEHFRRYVHALRFAIGLHGATQLLNINTTKFQVDREPIYELHYITSQIKIYWEILSVSIANTSYRYFL